MLVIDIRVLDHASRHSKNATHVPHLDRVTGSHKAIAVGAKRQIVNTLSRYRYNSTTFPGTRIPDPDGMEL
jgi:hypothetical protein